MSKIRQALKYERKLTNQQVQAHIDLTKAERKIERKLREQAVFYERKYTDGQFGQLNLVAQEHRIFHEREHLLYENAIGKAADSINGQLRVMEADFERMRELTHSFMTIERFDREHSNLAEKVELSFTGINEKLRAEETTTVQRKTRDDLLDSINKSNETSRRWMIGMVITVTLFGITTFIGLVTTGLHAFGII